jgi:ribosomal protein L37E
MRLPRFLRHDEPEETKCPRCGVPAPEGATDCTACGWDLHDAYHDPLVTQSEER